MEDEPRSAVEGLTPDDLDEVAEHVDDPEPGPAPSAAKPGGPLRFARMTGSSIAGRDAAGWVTDFLNAAYYRRPVDERDVDDMRLAFAILTTYWYRRESPRRLRLTDLRAFHGAYGRQRFDTDLTRRGLLGRDQLLTGAAAVVGDWFPDAYADDARRAWGIAFPTVQERDTYDPARRLRLAKLGRLTPESAPPDRQTWHTYPPVEMPSVEGVVGALTRPETWPTTPQSSGASLRCAPAASTARRSKSRWPRAPSPATRTTAARGCAPPARGTPCPGTSSSPTAGRGGPPNTRSGARAKRRG